MRCFPDKPGEVITPIIGYDGNKVISGDEHTGQRTGKLPGLLRARLGGKFNREVFAKLDAAQSFGVIVDHKQTPVPA